LSFSCLTLFGRSEEIRREFSVPLLRDRLDMIVAEDFTGRLSSFGGRTGPDSSVELKFYGEIKIEIDL